MFNIREWYIEDYISALFTIVIHKQRDILWVQWLNVYVCVHIYDVLKLQKWLIIYLTNFTQNSVHSLNLQDTSENSVDIVQKADNWVYERK